MKNDIYCYAIADILMFLVKSSISYTYFGGWCDGAGLISSVWWGWSGGAKVLGKLPVPGRPTILNTVGQGPTALAVGAGGGCLDIFTLIYPFSSLSPSLWETARYRLKYCLKGSLNPKQPVSGCPTNLDYYRARAYCACSRCGWGVNIFLSSVISLLSPALWEMAQETKILPQRPFNPKRQTNRMF